MNAMNSHETTVLVGLQICMAQTEMITYALQAIRNASIQSGVQIETFKEFGD